MQLLGTGIASHFFGQSWRWEQSWIGENIWVYCPMLKWHAEARVHSHSISVAHLLTCATELTVPLLFLRTITTKLIFRWKLLFPFWPIDVNNLLCTHPTLFYSFPLLPVIEQEFFWLLHIVRHYKRILLCLRWKRSNFELWKQDLFIWWI